MRELPFSDGSFPSVLSVQSLEHVPDPERVLAEVVRVLEPGGYSVAVFSTPNHLTLGRPDEIIDPYHHIEFDHAELAEICDRAFGSVEVRGLVGSPRYMQIVDDERQTLDRLLAKDPLRLRRLVPVRGKQLFFDRMLRRHRRRRSSRRDSLTGMGVAVRQGVDIFSAASGIMTAMIFRSRRGSVVNDVTEDRGTVLGEPDRIAASGDFHGAIEHRTAANREARSPDVEVELHRLRNLAGVAMLEDAATEPRYAEPSEPPAVDPITLVPEVEREELDPGILRAAILRSGCLLVRGLFDLGPGPMSCPRPSSAPTRSASRWGWAASTPPATTTSLEPEGDLRWATGSGRAGRRIARRGLAEDSSSNCWRDSRPRACASSSRHTSGSPR